MVSAAFGSPVELTLGQQSVAVVTAHYAPLVVTGVAILIAFGAARLEEAGFEARRAAVVSVGAGLTFAVVTAVLSWVGFSASSAMSGVAVRADGLAQILGSSLLIGGSVWCGLGGDRLMPRAAAAALGSLTLFMTIAVVGVFIAIAAPWPTDQVGSAIWLLWGSALAQIMLTPVLLPFAGPLMMMAPVSVGGSISTVLGGVPGAQSLTSESLPQPWLMLLTGVVTLIAASLLVKRRAVSNLIDVATVTAVWAIGGAWLMVLTHTSVHVEGVSFSISIPPSAILNFAGWGALVGLAALTARSVGQFASTLGDGERRS